MAKGVVAALAFALCLLSSTAAEAQPLLGRLSDLLTQQQSSGIYIPDQAAADATRDTVAALFLIELATVPTAASTGGFVYQFRSDLGLFERASNEFGPFFTERARRNSRGQASFGIGYQYANFGTLQGADLQDGTFPTNAARNTGAVDPFSVDTLQLDLIARTITPFVTYGVTDRLTVGAIVPFANVKFSGTRVRTVNGVPSLQSRQSGSSTGLGDIVVNGRYLLAGSGNRGVSVGADWRMPTGRQLDLLGTEDGALRTVAVGSWEDGQLALHVNGGFGLGGVSRELFWSTATTFAPSPHVTVIGELMGRRLTELGHVRDVYQPHPVLQGVETMRWLPADRGIHTMFVATGAKWNVARTWLLNTSLLIRVTDAGLRSRITPSISVDYTFDK